LAKDDPYSANGLAQFRRRELDEELRDRADGSAMRIDQLQNRLGLFLKGSSRPREKVVPGRRRPVRF
jgi:hypothetical protein